MHEPALGPSTTGSVVLELGPGIGALVLYTPPGLDGVEIAQPCIAVAAPLWMQCRHADEGTPQRHAGAHKALTETIEYRSGVAAAKSLAHHPRVQFDNLTAECVAKVQRRKRHRSLACVLWHRN